MEKATYSYKAPTTEELYALEKRAREERARALAALFASAVSAVKAFFGRAFALRPSKEVRHA